MEKSFFVENANVKVIHCLFVASVLAVFLTGLALVGSTLLPETALAQTADPVLVGAGDITKCSRTQDESTAQLLDGIAGTVVTLGDNAYPDGTLTQFNDCYGSTWGRHKARTKPSPGNHDYHTSGAAGYYTYFGTAASPLDSNCTSHCKGYYSYDLGDWHIIALNSEVAHGVGSVQEQWLRADLTAHQNVCTLAYWHKPRFSSGQHGNNSSVQSLWQALYDYGADVVLNGHDHTYERFAPQNPSGQADPTGGIREFVVGTGGAGLYSFTTIRSNSRVRNNATWGVLKLTLHPTSYDWEFVPVAGQTFTDRGSANCVSAGRPPNLPHTNHLPIILLGTSQPTASTWGLDSNWTRNTVKPPITNPQPPSTLLPPGTTALSLTVQSTENTTCAYGMGAAMPYDEMTPFDQGAGTTVHQTTLSNLDPDPNVVNNIYVRCASQPDYVLQLKYRSLSQANPSYPRTGNLWGWWDLHDKGLPYMSRIDLWLAAAGATTDEIRELRRLNPDMLILTNINAVDGADLPDDYYLKDIYGNRLEVWPNSYSLNLTKPYVAEYKARYAYQRMLDGDMMFDGVFFDNVFTTQSWRKHDIHGNLFLFDADENGVEDDPDTFDAAWKAGVFHELETFRALMPHAIVSGHAMDIYEPGIAEIFNGRSLGFRTADVLEGEMIFADLWDEYQTWHQLARQPYVTMIESSPPDQIAYGYDYSPWDKVPPSTLEFARTYYPYVRFGLALTLMNDGYFTHEFGDTWHGNDWWYDELDSELGYPLGAAERVDLGVPPGEDQMVNGGFEAEISDPWRFQVNASQGNVATVSRDTTDKTVGAASARIDVTATSGVDWHIHLSQYNRSLEQGVIYDISFWAKSDTQRTISLGAQKGSPDWRNYGLHRQVLVDTEWKKYTVSFKANETTNEARILFQVGETTGTVWLDEVSLTVRPPDVYQRKFTNGLVLLNGSQEQQEITVGPGYRRLQGQQAPRYETILDDGEAAFSTTGTWTSVKYDSGELQATGPFYHCWRENCHQRGGSQGEARWNLDIQAADTYTITTWWPAAPQADTWNQNVTYEVVAGEQVVAQETFDQRSGGDEWHFVAEVPLSPNNVNYVRMYCQGEAPCLADALHLRSRVRYNDGSPARKVTLQPLDGIILTRSNGSDVYLPVVLKK
jgi:hypothetical protein